MVYDLYKQVSNYFCSYYEDNVTFTDMRYYLHYGIVRVYKVRYADCESSTVIVVEIMKES